MTKTLKFIPYTCGLGASTLGCERAPFLLKARQIEKPLIEQGVKVSWSPFFNEETEDLKAVRRASEAYYAYIYEHLDVLAKETEAAVLKGEIPVCIGGDHSMAIGSVSGVVKAKKAYGKMGLLWIDAHLDAHTPETSPSKSIHGMPVAHLLGHGEERFIHLAGNRAKINPKNLCIIGARDYEEEEHSLLRDLGVKIFYMKDIKVKGMQTVMQEAQKIVSKNTEGVYLSFDLDGLDPSLADAVGTLVKDGITEDQLDVMLAFIKNNISLLGMDITEYNPLLDESGITTQTIEKILLGLFGEK